MMSTSVEMNFKNILLTIYHIIFECSAHLSSLATFTGMCNSEHNFDINAQVMWPCSNTQF